MIAVTQANSELVKIVSLSFLTVHGRGLDADTVLRCHEADCPRRHWVFQCRERSVMALAVLSRIAFRPKASGRQRHGRSKFANRYPDRAPGQLPLIKALGSTVGAADLRSAG